MRREGRHGRRGFTLIEATLSVFVVGLMLVAALAASGAAVRTRQVHSGHRIGASLARAMLGEVLQCRYRDPDEPGAGPGLDAGEDALDRSTWDDIDDYHGWSSSPPRTRDGATLELEGWSREVEVLPVSPETLEPLGTGAADSGIRLVRVTIISPGAVVTTLSALRADLDALEPPPILDTTYVHGVDLELQIGTDERARVYGGTDVLNWRPPGEEASP